MKKLYIHRLRLQGPEPLKNRLIHLKMRKKILTGEEKDVLEETRKRLKDLQCCQDTIRDLKKRRQ